MTSLGLKARPPGRNVGDQGYFDGATAPALGVSAKKVSTSVLILGVALAFYSAPVMAGAPEPSLVADRPATDAGQPTTDAEPQPTDVTPPDGDSAPAEGSVSVGTTQVSGAIDRLSQEILLSLKQRKTLVVWLFDQSISMEMQRQEVNQRLDLIYSEVGAIEAGSNPEPAKQEDRPLLTSVIAFGKDVQLLTKQPTADIGEIRAAINSIQPDDSGIENTFTAVDRAVDQYRSLRLREPRRNIMLIVFSDEVGNDLDRVDRTVTTCTRLEIPVYVVGVPAPFGQRQTLVKYINPDPKFDQTEQWAPLDQGPESVLPEVLHLRSPGGMEEEGPIDSGFGPYCLTRLCSETGGIYFAVHPNRDNRNMVSSREVGVFSAHLKYFFDPEVMQKYRPDYVSIKAYQRLLRENRARGALVAAAQLPVIAALESPRLVFVKRDEAGFANMLTDAQRTSAMLEPKINAIFETLKAGEKDRASLTEPRWQAGYDLAMGRTLATKARTEGYNLMLAKAKQGMRFQKPANNTWILRASDEISVGSTLEKQAQQSRMYLERVVKEHPGTPWALLAGLELQQKFGWEWSEWNTPVPQPLANRRMANPLRPRVPKVRAGKRDDELRMLERKLPPPPPPKL